MNGYYEFITNAGAFRIVSCGNGRWRIAYGGEHLGTFDSPDEAAESLCYGHTYPCSCGDTTALGIPESVTGWTFSSGG